MPCKHFPDKLLSDLFCILQALDGYSYNYPGGNPYYNYLPSSTNSSTPGPNTTYQLVDLPTSTPAGKDELIIHIVLY